MGDSARRAYARIEWLRAQIDEDERVAREVRPGRHRELASQVLATAKHGAHLHALFVAYHDPARVLREVEAKRRILDECLEAACMSHAVWTLADRVIRNLAIPYADRDGYAEHFAPVGENTPQAKITG